MGMANIIRMPEHRGPQLEDGYMRVANELGRAITFARLTSYQRCVLDVVMRQTYGFNKLADDIARTQFAGETGIDPSDVRRTINELVEMNIITRTEGRYAHSYSVNKRYASWDIPESRRYVKEIVEQGGNALPSGGELPKFEGGNHLITGGDFPPTKDNSKRHNQNTTSKEVLSVALRETFKIFWEKYPKKRSRAIAEKAFAKLNPNEQLLRDLLTGLERAVTSDQWNDPKFIPHASTWLNAAGWLDEIQNKYTDAEHAVIQAFNEAFGEQMGVFDASVFVESRAGAIRAFLGARPADPNFWKRYFPAVREKVDMPQHAGLDWLISPKGFSDVIARMAVNRNPYGTKAAGEWHTTASGIKAKAASLGVAFREDEPVPAITLRVWAAIEKQERRA